MPKGIYERKSKEVQEQPRKSELIRRHLMDLLNCRQSYIYSSGEDRPMPLLPKIDKQISDSLDELLKWFNHDYGIKRNDSNNLTETSSSNTTTLPFNKDNPIT